MNQTFPHDTDAERALLGACIISRGAIEDTIGIIGPDDFYVPAHQHIWHAITQAHALGRVDHVTIRDSLVRSGLLETVGGEATLFDLVNVTPAVSNASRYAEIITAHRLSARLIHAAADIAALGWRTAPSEDPIDALDRARDILANIEAPMTIGGPDMDIDQFIASTPTEYDWLIPDFLERGDRMLVTAGEGVGKSTLLRQIAVMAAAGIHPWNYRPIEPVNSLIIDCENAQRMVTRRLLRLQATAAPGLNPARMRVISKPEGLDLTSRTDRHWLMARCEANKTGLLVVGPAYRLFTGAPERGDAGGEALAVKVTRALDEVRAKCGVTLIMETHAGHGAGGYIRDLRPIGSSVWLRWPEFGIGLRRDGDSDTYELSHWRGPRDDRIWPTALSRHGRWPWTPEGMPPGTFQNVRGR